MVCAHHLSLARTAGSCLTLATRHLPLLLVAGADTCTLCLSLVAVVASFMLLLMLCMLPASAL
jgi:hypothetical protein